MASASWFEPFFQTRQDCTAVASTASEASLLAGINLQPTFYAETFTAGGRGFGKSAVIEAEGVFSNTGTPTLTFQARLSSTQGSSTLSGTSVGVSAAITTASGVSNVWWRLYLRLIAGTPGQGSGNTTLICNGSVVSPAGFASPFIYPLEPTTPNTATWTATIDGSQTQFLNLSVTWSASSASNTITCKTVQGYFTD